MSQKKNKKNKDRPSHFRDRLGRGKKDSTYQQLGFVPVPQDFNAESGSDEHPGPFVSQSQKMFFGIQPRRNTPNKPEERAGKVLMKDVIKEDDRYYRPEARVIHRNFAKKALRKKHH